jgi:alpha-L-fucosidase
METCCLMLGQKRTAQFQPVKMELLQALGAWRKQNGAANYGTHPWARAEGETAEGVRVRFTRTDSAVGAILLGKPRLGRLLSSRYPRNREIFVVGSADPLTWSQQGQ